METTTNTNPLAVPGTGVRFTDSGAHGVIMDRETALVVMPVLFHTGGWIPVQFDDGLQCWCRWETLEVLY